MVETTRYADPLRADVGLGEGRGGAAGLPGEAEGAVLRGPRDAERQPSGAATAVVRAEVLHPDDLRFSVADYQLAVADEQSTGRGAGDANRERFSRRSVDAVAEREFELVGRRRARKFAVETDVVFIANSSFIDIQLREVLSFVQLQITNPGHISPFCPDFQNGDSD